MLRLLFLLFFLLSHTAYSQTVATTDSSSVISTQKVIDTHITNADTGYARVEVIGNKGILRQFQEKIQEQEKKEKRRTYIRIAFGIFILTLLILLLLKRLRNKEA